MLSISSEKNSLFRDLLTLKDSKFIKKQRRFLVSGEKIVRELLARHHQEVQSLIVESGTPPEKVLNGQNLPLIVLDKHLFKQLDWFGTHFPLAVCGFSSLPSWESSLPCGLELLLAQGDPSNLGAAIRSAQAFGVEKIILLKEAALAFHPKVIRASSGTVLSSPLFRGPSITDLNSISDLFVLDLEGKSLNEFKWPRRARLLVGEEGPGIPTSTPGQRLFIPTHPQVESLNATVAASIALYSYRLQHPG